MTVAIGPQGPVGRGGPELQPEICQRPVFDREQDSPPSRFQHCHSGIAADGAYLVVRPVPCGEKVAAPGVLVFEAAFQNDHLGLQRAPIDFLEDGLGLLDGFHLHPLEQFVADLDRSRLEIGPARERAQTSVDLHQGSDSEVIHHQARLRLHFRGFVRERASPAQLDCEPRFRLSPSVGRLRGGRDAVHHGLAKSEGVRTR